MHIPLIGRSNVLLQTQEFSLSSWPEGHPKLAQWASSNARGRNHARDCRTSFNRDFLVEFVALNFTE
jgi:hypothetical protein